MSTGLATVTAIVALLKADSAVVALASTRVWSVKVPQGSTTPYVVQQQTASDPDRSHTEAASATHRQYQFACFASTYETALALRDAVIAALDNTTLSTGDRLMLDDERDADLDEAVNLYRADCDFLV